MFCLERGVKEPPDEVEALDADNMAEVSPRNDRRPRGPGMERGGWRVGCLSASGAMDCRRRWYVGVSPAATRDVLDRPRSTDTAGRHWTGIQQRRRRRRRRREAATAFIFRAPGSSDGWCEARGETTSAERAREIRRGARERERERARKGRKAEDGTIDRGQQPLASRFVRSEGRSVGG